MNQYEGLIQDEVMVKACQEELPFPVFCDIETDIRGTGAGKAMLGYKAIEKAYGRFHVRHQKGPSCVSMGEATACDMTYAFDITVNKAPYEFIAPTSTEDIYSGSRVIIGGNKLRGGGSLGIWGARYTNEYGTLFRKQYGEYDLTNYRYDLETRWANRKIPQELLDAAANHKMGTITQVENYEEARDLLFHGYGITIASDVGFTSSKGRYHTIRDKDGFARPRGSWMHQMCVIAMDDSSGRPGLLVVNSWGVNCTSGPKKMEQPDASFWIDPETFNRIARQGDTWARSTKIGFPKTVKDTGESLYV